MSSRIYIGNMNPYTREDDVKDFLRGYRGIRNIMLKNGFCFVDFEYSRDAYNAVNDLHGRMLCGERVRVDMAKGTPRGAGGKFLSGYTPPRHYSSLRRNWLNSGGKRGWGRPQNGYRLIVTNLTTRCKWYDLKDLFDRCGRIFYINAHDYRLK